MAAPDTPDAEVKATTITAMERWVAPYTEHQNIRQFTAVAEVPVPITKEGLVEVLIPGVAVPDFPGTPEMTAVVRLGRGQIFGEMALVDRGARSATVRCVQDDTTLFIIGRDALAQLCESDYHIGYVVMQNLARDLSFKLRLRNLLTRNA